MAAPLISVVITAYNAAEFISETLDGIRSQGFRDFEILVVDDGSTDGTAAIVREYTDVRYVHQANAGQPAARNTGIRNALGSYIAFVDADDLWMPDKLEKQMACLGRRPEAAWIYSDALAFHSDSRAIFGGVGERKLHEGDILRPLLLSSFIPSATPVVRKSVFSDVGLFDESCDRRIGEDWNMWLRIAAKYPVAVIKEPLALIRIHEGNMTRITDPGVAYRSKRSIMEAAMSRNRDRLIDLRPRALANLATDAGIAYIRSNNPAAARGMFSEAIRQVPLDVSTYGYLAMTYFPTSFAYSLRALRRQLHSRGVLPRGLVRR